THRFIVGRHTVEPEFVDPRCVVREVDQAYGMTFVLEIGKIAGEVFPDVVQETELAFRYRAGEQNSDESLGDRTEAEDRAIVRNSAGSFFDVSVVVAVLFAALVEPEG